MHSPEQRRANIEPARRKELASPLRFTKDIGNRRISPPTDPWPDPPGDIERPKRENAFSQVVIVDA